MKPATETKTPGKDALATVASLKPPKPGEFGGQFVVTPDYSLAPKMHTGGIVPKDGVYTLQKGEVIIPAEKHSATKDEPTSDVRIPEHIGIVHSGGNERQDSPVQPLADTEHGAQDARERKSASKVTGGTHVHAGGDPDGNRVDYVSGEYDRKSEKTASPSGRKSLKELVEKSKGL